MWNSPKSLHIKKRGTKGDQTPWWQGLIEGQQMKRSMIHAGREVSLMEHVFDLQ